MLRALRLHLTVLMVDAVCPTAQETRIVRGALVLGMGSARKKLLPPSSSVAAYDGPVLKNGAKIGWD